MTLPDKAIQTVHRSDSSGTTNIFTGYLTSVNQAWADAVGKGKEVKWPVGVGGKGNDGVAAVVQQQEGVDRLRRALLRDRIGLTMATLKNSRQLHRPQPGIDLGGGRGRRLPRRPALLGSNSANADAYPIVGATWILAYDKMPDAAKAEALKAFLTWSLTTAPPSPRSWATPPSRGSESPGSRQGECDRQLTSPPRPPTPP